MDENYRKKVVVVMMILIIPTLVLKMQADDDRFPPLHPSSSTPSPSAPLSPSRLVGDGISKTKLEEICRRKCVAICLMKVVKDKSFEFFNYYYDGCMYECKTGQKDRRSKPPPGFSLSLSLSVSLSLSLSLSLSISLSLSLL
jgi:hypothetical protein